MILTFWLVVFFLLIAGAFRMRFQQATLYWGRAIAGVAYVQRDIEQAKGSGDPALAAELLGRSVHQRGLQDAITPPRQTNLTIMVLRLSDTNV